jgi:AcrR family transcriptional regulator
MERTPTDPGRLVGRKRDPRVEPLALNAAIEVYALHGWHGFTIDAVARTSGIGKPAIYRRWSSREELLITAFSRTNFPDARDLGSLDADVRDYVNQWVQWYATPFLPQAGNRLMVDCVGNAELDRLYQEHIFEPRRRSARQVTRRAAARGEIPEGRSTGILPNLILGGMFMQWVFATYRDTRDYVDLFRADAEQLADVVLAGLRSDLDRTPKPPASTGP